MKKLIAILLGLTLHTTSAKADDTALSVICPSFGKLAHTVMRNRQDGVSLSAMMGTFAEADEALKSTIRKIVLDAYGRPRFSVPENQEIAVQDFQNEVELACYKSK